MFALRGLPPAMPEVHAERVARNGDVEIVTQAFGDKRDPAVLLVMGANAPMTRWPEEFCLRLAAAGRYVIRYDNRDTGQSSTFPVGSPGYDVRDLAADAIAVLNLHRVAKAHVVGMSMGGMIAQHLAVLHPLRVASLALVGTTPDPSAVAFAIGEGADNRALPMPWQKAIDLIGLLACVDWSDRRQAEFAWVLEETVLLGSGDKPDREASLAEINVVLDRARDVASHRINHPIAVATTPRWRDELWRIRCPTLVFHGCEDAVLPLEHGRALQREITDASLLEVEGMGHIIAPGSAYWMIFANALISHTARTNTLRR
jgi:pimeloyl-ACP methyl ester carboxylesterase